MSTIKDEEAYQNMKNASSSLIVDMFRPSRIPPLKVSSLLIFFTTT